MVHLDRVHALYNRYIQQLFRDQWRFVSVFYWPLIDLTLFGFTGAAQGNTTNAAYVLVMGAILWALVAHTYFSVIWNMLEELSSENIVSLFASSVTIQEWMLALTGVAGTIMGVLTIYLFTAAYFIYGFSFFGYIVYLLPILLNLFIFSISLGFILNAALFFAGIRGRSLVFMVGYLFAPFVGVYYSIGILPLWMQLVAHCLPPMYVFMFTRALVLTNTVLWSALVKALLLNTLWISFGCWSLQRSFESSKQKGLTRLVD